MNEPCENTDKEIWRAEPGDYYSDSIHVTENGGIGINCGGIVFTKPIRQWHALAALTAPSTTEGLQEAIDYAAKHSAELYITAPLPEKK
jgi:hypothetical protein